MSEAITKAAQQEISPELRRMTAHRAVFFLERFKKEEKMLGPNEQAALDFAMAALSQSQQTAPASLPAVDVTDAPAEIWLQVNADGSPSDTGYPADHEGVTWCWHSIGGQEVRYVRADLALRPSRAPAKLPQGMATSREGDDWRVTLIFKDGDDAKALAGYMSLQGVPAANALVPPAPAVTAEQIAMQQALNYWQDRCASAERKLSAVTEGAAGGQEVVYIQPNHLQMAMRAPHMCRVAPTRIAEDFVPLHTTPQPTASMPVVPEGVEVRDARWWIEAIVDIWKDHDKAPEHRVYVSGALDEAMQEAEAMLSAAPKPAGKEVV